MRSEIRSTPKKLTRIEAWKKIRLAFKRRIAAGVDEETGVGEETNIRDLAARGLCHAVHGLDIASLINGSTNAQMRGDIRSVRPASAVGRLWYWGFDLEGSRARVKAINQILKRLERR